MANSNSFVWIKIVSFFNLWFY